MLRGEHDKSDRRSSSALDRGMPSRAEYLPLIMASMPTFSHAQNDLAAVRCWPKLHTSRTRALESARRASMIHDQHAAWGGGIMRESRGNVA